MAMSTDLSGRVAVVTGASSGLGRAVARRLCDHGALVALLARSHADLDEVAEEIRAAGGQAVPVPSDLADPAAIETAIARVVAELGPPQVLVNAAATDAPGPAETLAVTDWERVLRVNLTAPFLLTKLVFPHMRDAGGGIVVNVSSVAGRRGWANASAYCASKFALTGLTQALAAEGATHNIRVVSVYPGAMATQWGTFDPAARRDHPQQPPQDALPADDVADYISWIVTAPAHLVVTEAVVAPLRERGWP
jgi:NAD(P)-dependent dehydrogenase (short-subunit alcohol dehydrogenase family)